jgi:hypothetical protein
MVPWRCTSSPGTVATMRYGLRARVTPSLLALTLALGVMGPALATGTVTWVDRVEGGTGLAIASYGRGVYVAGDLHDEAYLWKYSPEGEARWSRRVAPARVPGGSAAYGVAAGPSGVFVVGYTYGAFPGQPDRRGQDAFLAAYTHGGRLLWARQIAGRMTVRPSECTGEDLVCPDSEDAFGVALGPRSVYVAGRAYTLMPGASPHDRGFLLRYTFDGRRVWTRTFRQEGWAVGVGSSGIYVTSFAEPQVRRFLPDGMAVWTRGRHDRDASFSGVDVRGGVVYLAGDRRSDGLVRALDPSGRRLWSSSIGTKNTQTLRGVAAQDGLVRVVGTTYGRFPDQPDAGGDFDLLIAELDTDGGVRWIKQIGGPKGEQGRGIAISGSASFVTSGTSGPFLGLPAVHRSMLALRLDS